MTLHYTTTAQKMIMFWNEEAKNQPSRRRTFNIKDATELRSSVWKLFLQTKPAGHVSIAGYAAPFTWQANMQTSWLLGGDSMVERYHRKHKHPLTFQQDGQFAKIWYSYPLGRNYRLMVAADAKVHHNETYSKMSFRQGTFYGLSGAIMRYHFVRQNPDLKTWAYIWMTIGIIIGNLGRGLLGSPRHLGLCFGGIEGLLRATACSLANRDSTDLAKALNNR